MIFEIDRASFVDDTKQPCDGAKLNTRIEKEQVGRHASVRKYWYKVGKNHRVEDGKLTRDLEHEVWEIEINSLEELMSLIDKEGRRIVLGRSYRFDNMGAITIYDDYLE